MKTVIIGGVAGGASAAARLRRLDEKAEIVILERGPFVSFANCGLPYYIGGTITEKSDLTLQSPESLRARFNIDVRVKHEAVKINPARKTVTVRAVETGKVYEENYDKLILSPGAEPVRPPVKGIENERVFTLRNIPDTEKIKDFIAKNNPKNAVIIGGGYIGVEMAENLANAGIKVTIVELADHLITSLDYDMAADVHQYLRKKGICLILGNGLREIAEDGSLVVKLQNGEIKTDMVILAVGVRPDTGLAKDCGIETDQRGAILVNENMQTSIPDIYAVGDAVQVKNFITNAPAFIPLAGPANKQGRIAADNICGINSRYTGTQGSAILKIFDMTVASTGLNELAAKAAAIDYDKTYLYSVSHADYYPGATHMSIKVLWEKTTHKLLGAQIVGYDGVDKRMDVLATAIRFGAKVTDLKDLELCYAPPFGSAKDPVNMIGFVAENVITGKVKQFFWDEVDSLPRDGSVFLLDVRTKTEVARGKIEGFVNIPLNNLRERLNEIPRDKPVYVHCHSGLRSYIACRILTGYGYDCRNLAGGYRLYETAVHEKSVRDYICTECE
ncbi:FAD-dependent oxidoreductase [Thermocaproicibacter melissae]|jgi:NADPH-dependent 2,4-dienoyl-CoA reductase/sulfur reductase-like enzyme/rhodanese-related sulfurtransferase|uniref:FAD-dependent oxidoreductase n=1 Tax=Thermocaproicibacter melissae TaxID=2966552 RepID=UPI0024B1AE8F|nr:FAD-dependent oxidoreductase [Thermocaproicibacter melissae]WBY64929.1 FAD-dependent oxidoreductase [Thermocaproicibacter melissae]